MRRPGLGVLGLSLLAPAPALACSLCVHAQLQRSYWWIDALPLVALGLLAEATLFGLAAWLLNRRRDEKIRGRVRSLALACVCAIALALVGGAPIGAAGFALVMTVRLARSVWDWRPVFPRLGLARIGAVASIATFSLLSSQPEARSTAWLVGMSDGLLHRAAVPAHLAPESWVERELIARPDAPERILTRLGKIEPNPPEYHRNRDRILRLLRVHAMAEGARDERFLACRQLGVEPDWHELVRSLNAPRVCGFETRELAAR